MFVLEYISFIDSYQRRHKNVWWSCWCQLHAPFSPCLSEWNICLRVQWAWQDAVWVQKPDDAGLSESWTRKRDFFQQQKIEGREGVLFLKKFRTFLLFRLELIFVCALFYSTNLYCLALSSEAAQLELSHCLPPNSNYHFMPAITVITFFKLICFLFELCPETLPTHFFFFFGRSQLLH